MEVEQIIRRPEALRMVGISKSVLYRLIAEGSFPRPVRLSKNSVGWKLSAIQEWIASRPEVEAIGRTTTEPPQSAGHSTDRDDDGPLS